MAVWLIAWGKNQIGDINITKDYFKGKGTDIPIDLSFLSNLDLVSPWNESVTIDYQYKADLWQLEEYDDWFRLIYALPSSIDKYYDNPYWKFSLNFHKDIISFSGPFNHFSHWGNVCADENLKKGWLAVIRTIYRYCGVDRVIFFTEWGFGYEDVEGFFELENHVRKHPSRVADDLSALSDDQRLYIEELAVSQILL